MVNLFKSWMKLIPILMSQDKFLNDDELVSGMMRSGFFDKDHIKFKIS